VDEFPIIKDGYIRIQLNEFLGICKILGLDAEKTITWIAGENGRTPVWLAPQWDIYQAIERAQESERLLAQAQAGPEPGEGGE